MDQTSEELNEENREVILRMARGGDDLSKSRDIDFSVVFPNESSAQEFASQLREIGYRATVNRSDVDSDLPWDATVVRHMLPQCEAITGFELLLQARASPFGGRNDGWGCFEQKRSDPH